MGKTKFMQQSNICTPESSISITGNIIDILTECNILIIQKITPLNRQATIIDVIIIVMKILLF